MLRRGVLQRQVADSGSPIQRQAGKTAGVEGGGGQLCLAWGIPGPGPLLRNPLPQLRH